MKLSEHIRTLKRGTGLLFSLSKTYAVCFVFDNLIRAILPYVPIYFSALLIDGLVCGAPVRLLALYVLLTVGIVFMLSLTDAWLSARLTVSQNSLYRNESWLYSEKAMEMAYASIEDREVRALHDRIRKESQTGYNLFNQVYWLGDSIHALAQILLSCSMTVSFFTLEALPLSGRLAIGAGILLSAACSTLAGKKEQKTWMDFLAKCVRFNVLSEKFSQYEQDYKSGKDIRMYGMADSLLSYISRFYRTITKDNTRVNLLAALWRLLGTGVTTFLLRLGVYSLLLYATLQGNISVGSITRYVSCILLLLTAVSKIASVGQLMVVNNTYLKRYFSYFDIPNDMYKGSLTIEKRDDNECDVEFRDVSFRYPNTQSYALRHVSLKFRVGQRLAIVGENGSGKTTFIKLLCRLYDPTEGEILLNGVNIQKYDYDEYMSIFSVVFQDFNLFAFSIGQNVATNTDYDADRASLCLQKAGFGERLASMPAGLQTCLYKDYDPDGVEISGGEAQKIALARALYKDSPFLILDEPTAALDPVAEYEVYTSFNQIASDKTTVYISHRLASCRFCDTIAVFDRGQIVQTGDHASLLAAEGGKYQELWHAQAQYYT